MNSKLSAVLMTGLLGATTCAYAQSTTQPMPPNPSLQSSPSSPQSAAGQNSSAQSSADSSSTGDIESGSSTSKHTMSAGDRQFMKKCMTDAKQSNDGMSEKDMKKSCHQQLKQHAVGEQDKPTTPQY